MKRLSALPFILVFLFNSIQAQPLEQFIDIHIKPNHADYLYKEGEKVTFDVTVYRSGVELKDAHIEYQISEDMMPPHKEGKLSLKDGTTKLDGGTMKQAGFLRCKATIQYEGKEYKGLCTVGFSPESIKPTGTRPDDFISYWENAIEQTRKIPLDARMTLIPDKCTSEVNVYKVNFQNEKKGSRIFGILTMPKAEGKYPALLRIPGAGVRSYTGNIAKAAEGFIVLEIGIHGIPVDLPEEVYDNLYNGALNGYFRFNFNDKEKFYYKRVLLGCIRANDFLTSLTEYDGINLISYGGSQGGALSIMTASLDKRVKALIAFYPALCDQTGALHGRAGGWPYIFRNGANDTSENKEALSYYDVVNFASRLTVPGFFSFGYNDMVCPPTSVYSAINTITSPKDILIMETTEHYTYPEQWDAAWKWVDKQINQ